MDQYSTRMKQFLFFILLIGLSSKSFGQMEFTPKFKAIPPKNTDFKPKKVTSPITEKPNIVAPSVFTNTNILNTKTKANNSFQIGVPDNKFSMDPTPKFEHKMGDVYQDKMTKDLDKTMIREGVKEDLSQLDRTDGYLGEYHTKSPFLIVKYRDYILVDGDLINVYLNDKLLRSQIYLNADFGELKITLTQGINNIDFVVASTGTSGGNTAELHVLDDANKTITTQYWDNKALGVKIKMIIVKE